ncbi:hypothetical protein, partial [Francisella tularensis]|uniref:hypothetical protein n=1 Tax=Francisella tularensis TaxID=263 RepID=UPI001CC2EBB9
DFVHITCFYSDLITAVFNSAVFAFDLSSKFCSPSVVVSLNSTLFISASKLSATSFIKEQCECTLSASICARLAPFSLAIVLACLTAAFSP